jgi:hypothetical protein
MTVHATEKEKKRWNKGPFMDADGHMSLSVI